MQQRRVRHTSCDIVYQQLLTGSSASSNLPSPLISYIFDTVDMDKRFFPLSVDGMASSMIPSSILADSSGMVLVMVLRVDVGDEMM